MTKPAQPIPDTRASLLIQLQSGQDETAWQEFVALYRPVVYRLARGRGLQDADAQDLAQTVLVSIAGTIQSWQKRKGTPFRHWLRKVAKNEILKALSRQPKDRAQGGTSIQVAIGKIPETNGPLETQLELERQRELYFQAASLVRTEVASETWQVFQLAVVEKVPIEEVAERLNKSIGAAYAARGRVMNRLQKTVKRLDEGIEQ